MVNAVVAADFVADQKLDPVAFQMSFFMNLTALFFATAATTFSIACFVYLPINAFHTSCIFAAASFDTIVDHKADPVNVSSNVLNTVGVHETLATAAVYRQTKH